jgi:hypothetical protein
MIENTENTVSNPQTHEELVIALATLRGELMVKDQQLASMRSSRDNIQATHTKVQKFIQASIDNGDWTDDELEEIFWEELAEILNLEISKTVEIIIKAEWSATVKIKRDKSIEDIDISLNEPEISHFSSDEMTDVSERSFEVEEA